MNTAVTGNDDSVIPVLIEAETSCDKEPLMKLMKSLVNDNDKEPITTSLLLRILNYEFHINSKSKSELDMEIYVNVLKKYLKIWHRWDAFDVQMAKTPKEEKNEMLMVQCRKLKKYLKKKLEMTEAQITPTINSMQSTKRGKKSFKDTNKPASSKQKGTCVLDVICTRERLTNLFYNRPCGKENATLFNITDGPLLKNISLENNFLKFCDIVNWPYLTVKVVLPNFEYTRTNSSHFDRKLVNLKNQQFSSNFDNLSPDLYWKSISKKKAVFRKNILVSFIVQILHYISSLDINSTKKLNLTAIFEEIKKDFLAASSQIHVNAEYQFFLSKYPYIRHICTRPELPETKKETDMNRHFNLQLQEVISPAITFQMPKFAVNFCEDQRGRIFLIDYAAFTDPKNNWLKLSCSSCEINFDGFLSSYEIEQHFNEMHNFEPPWKCSHCQAQFSAKELSLQRWHHNCKSNNTLL